MKWKGFVSIASAVMICGSLLAGCGKEEAKKETEENKPKVGLEKAKTKEADKVKLPDLLRLYQIVFDGGTYYVSVDRSNKDTKTDVFKVTYKNTTKKDVTFKYADNKRISLQLIDSKGKVVKDELLDVKDGQASSETVPAGSTFGYSVMMDNVPDGVYTLLLTHFGKSKTLPINEMNLVGLTFKGNLVTVTTVTKADMKKRKVVSDRPEDKSSTQSKVPESVKEAAKKDKDLKLPEDTNTKQAPGTKTVRKGKEQSEKVSAMRAEVTFNGWADSHSVEVMLAGTPSVFQVGEKATGAVEKLKEGDKVSFVFTQKGETREVIGVLK